MISNVTARLHDSPGLSKCLPVKLLSRYAGRKASSGFSVSLPLTSLKWVRGMCSPRCSTRLNRKQKGCPRGAELRFNKMKKMVWMFAGQGTQYYQMGMELYESEPVFRQFMDRADLLVHELINESLVDIIYRPRADRFEPFHRLLHTHPAILIFECALAEVLLSRGFRPDYLLGYSLGEFACLVISEAISFEDALAATIKQAELVERCVPRGQMLAILDSADLVDRHPEAFRQCVLAPTILPGILCFLLPL